MSPKNEASREKQAEIHNRLKKLNEDLPPSTVKIVAKAYQNLGFIKKSTFQDWFKKSMMKIARITNGQENTLLGRTIEKKLLL